MQVSTAPPAIRARPGSASTWNPRADHNSLRASFRRHIARVPRDGHAARVGGVRRARGAVEVHAAFPQAVLDFGAQFGFDSNTTQLLVCAAGAALVIPSGSIALEGKLQQALDAAEECGVDVSDLGPGVGSVSARNGLIRARLMEEKYKALCKARGVDTKSVYNKAGVKAAEAEARAANKWLESAYKDASDEQKSAPVLLVRKATQYRTARLRELMDAAGLEYKTAMLQVHEDSFLPADVKFGRYRLVLQHHPGHLAKYGTRRARRPLPPEKV